MPRIKPKHIKRTSPDSLNKYRVEYEDYDRWTSDKPDDGRGDPRRQRQLEKSPKVKRLVRKLEEAAYGDGTWEKVKEVCEDIREGLGKERSSLVVGKVLKWARVLAKDDDSDKNKKAVEILKKAKEYTSRDRGRRRTDSISRFLRIARRVERFELSGIGAEGGRIQ